MEINTKQLSASYNRHHFVLDKIDININAGSKVALVGPNGSGKSTFLRALMGFINFKGSILFDGVPNTNLSVKEKISYVPQITPYFSSLVRDVVESVLAIRRIPYENFEKILEQLFLNFNKIKSTSFKDLSGGMKKKLMIALAFSADSHLVFLDEPTSNLDSKSRYAFYKLCESLGSQVTLVLCSHQLDEIRHIVTQVLELEKHKIKFSRKTENFFEERVNCIVEILINEGGHKQAMEMGFINYHANWWHQVIKQSEKLKMIEKVQKVFKKDINNIVIKDTDVEESIND